MIQVINKGRRRDFECGVILLHGINELTPEQVAELKLDPWLPKLGDSVQIREPKAPAVKPVSEPKAVEDDPKPKAKKKKKSKKAKVDIVAKAKEE